MCVQLMEFKKKSPWLEVSQACLASWEVQGTNRAAGDKWINGHQTNLNGSNLLMKTVLRRQISIVCKSIV